MDTEDVAAYRAMTPEQRLARGLEFIRRVGGQPSEAWRWIRPF